MRWNHSRIEAAVKDRDGRRSGSVGFSPPMSWPLLGLAMLLVHASGLVMIAFDIGAICLPLIAFAALASLTYQTRIRVDASRIRVTKRILGVPWWRRSLPPTIRLHAGSGWHPGDEDLTIEAPDEKSVCIYLAGERSSIEAMHALEHVLEHVGARRLELGRPTRIDAKWELVRDEPTTF